MKYYLVGIKGSGMAGLAQILYDLGHDVKGADVNQEIFIEHQLQSRNIIIESFDEMHYEDADIIVVGNAFLNKFDFKDKKIKTYQEMLSTLNDRYFSIAVCGTHGKTTTTNMIKHVLSQIYPISYLVGDGQGKGDKNAQYFVYEACEHRDHFLSYHPNMIVCGNIDYDHVEYFTSKKQYRNSFKQFFRQCKNQLILNDSIDYKRNVSKVTFGINNAELKAKNIKYTENGIYFDMTYQHKNYLSIHLPFYGKHMLLDALACIACCISLNVEMNQIIEALKSYKEAGRRYNITFVKSNIIIDDYGHHPNEIASTINAIFQEFPEKKLYIVYHPDRPKRLMCFLKKYIHVFHQSKKAYVLPFLHMGEEEEKALRMVIDNKKIFMYNSSFLNESYENCVFLFTGSKEMKPIIHQLIQHLEK